MLCGLFLITETLNHEIKRNVYPLRRNEIFCLSRCVAARSGCGAEYTVNLRLKTDFTHAAETDELDGTINYASVHEAVKSEMATPSKLLEHVAYRIAQRLFHDFPTLEEIKIELFKQNPPMGAQGNAIGIEVTYTKD